MMTRLFGVRAIDVDLSVTNLECDMSDKDRSGAESLVQTLVDADVNVCFANPGTSEMHFVAALDTNPDMRCVLGLFEGIVLSLIHI